MAGYYLYKSGEANSGFGDETKYRDGSQVTNFDGVTWVISGADPGRQLYEAIEDATVEAYSTLVRTDLSFEGTEGNAAARVSETRVWEEISIDQLYDLKRQDIRNQDQDVRYNAVDTALSANWWIVVTEASRFEILGIQGNWLQRQIDSQGFPSGPNAPWIGIYNATTFNARRVQVTDAVTWDTLFLEITLHDQATGNATDASVTALDAAYGDGDQANFDAVAAHDPADLAWDYPLTVDESDLTSALI